LIASCAAIILYVFATEAPFIAEDSLHLSADHFGLYNLIPNIGFLLGGIASAHLGHRLSSKAFIALGGSGFFLFSAIMWLFFETGFVNIFSLFCIPLLIFLVSPVILSQAQVSSLAASEDKIYASSCLSILSYFGMVLSVTVLGLFPAKSPMALPIVYTGSGLLILIFLGAVHLSDRCKT
jgi:predicted MFS family arabinose efflux permease